MQKQGLPEIGKTYNYFDDGKITESRRESVLITDIIPFDKISKKILSSWKCEMKQCDWLYAQKTDYFIRAHFNSCKDILKDIYFVRTIDGDWFSLGWWAGRLDVDGSLNNMLLNNIN